MGWGGPRWGVATSPEKTQKGEGKVTRSQRIRKENKIRVKLGWGEAVLSWTTSRRIWGSIWPHNLKCHVALEWEPALILHATWRRLWEGEGPFVPHLSLCHSTTKILILYSDVKTGYYSNAACPTTPTQKPPKLINKSSQTVATIDEKL